MASRLVRTNPVTVNDMLDGPVASVQRGSTTAGTSRTTWPSSNAHLCSRPPLRLCRVPASTTSVNYGRWQPTGSRRLRCANW